VIFILLQTATGREKAKAPVFPGLAEKCAAEFRESCG